jgi:hypothetical protein
MSIMHLIYAKSKPHDHWSQVDLEQLLTGLIEISKFQWNSPTEPVYFKTLISSKICLSVCHFARRFVCHIQRPCAIDIYVPRV